MGGGKSALWWLLVCVQGLQLSNAGSRFPLVNSARNQLEGNNVNALLRDVGGSLRQRGGVGASLRLRGGLEMKLDLPAEDLSTQRGRATQSMNKRSRSPELDKTSSSSGQSRALGGPSTPKRTRVRSASADRRRRNRSASPRVGYAYAGKGNVWRSGTALGLSGLNVPCDGRLEEPIIDILDTMDNISWPHRTIKELRNDGMDQDDIAFLTGDVTPIGKAAKDWARHTMGIPRRVRDGRGKTPASLARAQARMAEITASMRSLSPSTNETVAGAEAKVDGEDDEEALVKRRVLVCDLPEGTTEEDVQHCMALFGKVEAVRIQRVVLFACVTFASEVSRGDALRRGFVNFRGFQLDLKPAPKFNSAGGERERNAPNARVVVSRSRGRAIETPGTGIKSVARFVETGVAETDEHGQLRDLPWAQNTIVVHGLPAHTTETHIRSAFARCGRIASTSLADLVAGQSKYAIVKFYSAQSLQTAGLMDGMKINGQEVRIREQGQTKSFVEALNDRDTVHEDDEMAYYLQTQNMPGSGQK
mmetsp:Transcript_6274/g.14547  ORF Transcript_6274/g.14547 Transcript_6274/m.14547 type:complete len:533 (+) Transcript_6274:246-1844(+)